MSSETVTRVEKERLEKDLADRDALVAALRDLIASLEGRNAALQNTLINHANEIELLKRRLFGTRTERMGTHEMQLLLGELLADEAPLLLQKELDQLTKGDREVDEPAAPTPPDDLATPAAPPDAPAKPGDRPRSKPKGRRDLSASKLPP